MEKTRVEWVDIFKLLGIFAIFCGHFGNGTGKLHDFVFYYHVPLFFFASGLFADHLLKLSFGEAVKKRFRQIAVPYLFLVIVNMGIIIITSDSDLITYVRYGKQFVFGIRNQIPASSLWFFSCIFCMGIFFEILLRILKRKTLLMGAAVLLHLASVFLFPNRPDITPSWIWNIDSACHYMIYYALGYVLHTRLLQEKGTTDKKRLLLNLLGTCLLAGYVLSVYLQEDIVGDLLYRVLPAADIIYPILRAVLIIYLNVILAKALTGSGFLACAGAQTLWLCGNESVVKKICGAAVSIIGLQIEITSVAAGMFYAVVMTVIIMKMILPVEKKLYQKFCQYF